MRDGSASGEVTALLMEWGRGDSRALDAMVPLVYDELRRIADRYLRKERDCRTLQATALVHEAFLRLAGEEKEWANRAHFYAIAANTMRRILIDHARRKQSEKRGGGLSIVPLDDHDVAAPAGAAIDVLALDAALDKLESLDARQARIVELRFFAGLDVEQTAAALSISTATVKREWRTARAWLLRELTA